MKTRDKERSWAFDNGGFLTGKQLFDILLLKDPEALKDLMENENSDVITKEELTGKYRSFLSRSITGITEEERERLIKQGTESGRDAGNLSTVIKSTDWEIRLGSCCKKRGEWCVEASLKEGNVKGLVARGGFEIDLAWKEGRLTQVVVRSRHGGTCRLRSLVPLKGKGLKVAKGKNPNPLFQVPEIAKPLINGNQQLTPTTLKKTYLYDFETVAGREYRFN